MSDPQAQRRRFNLYHVVKTMENRVEGRYDLADGSTNGKVKLKLNDSVPAAVPVPLTGLREISSNDIAQSYDTINRDIALSSLRETDATNILDITDTPKTDTTIGGVLGQSTTPSLDHVNGDTDSNLEVQWTTSGQDAVVFKTALDDIDVSNDLTITLRGKMSGSDDTPTMAADVYFNEGDTKVEEVSGAFSDSVANATITVAAADIPAGARYITCELTPGDHTTDTMHLYEIQVSYTAATENLQMGLLGKSTTPILEYTNGDTDSALRLNWASSNSDPVAFQLPLPPDLDTSEDVEVHFRGSMSGTDDTPTLAIDSYFNEGDTKVEDVSGALSDSAAEVTATIAAADVPTGAQTLTVEVTPDAHTTDDLYLYAVWVEYSRYIASSRLEYHLAGKHYSKAADSGSQEIDDLFDCTSLTDTSASEYCKVLLTLDSSGDGQVHQGDIESSQALSRLPFPSEVKSGDEAIAGWIEMGPSHDWDAAAVSADGSYYEGYDLSKAR